MPSPPNKKPAPRPRYSRLFWPLVTAAVVVGMYYIYWTRTAAAVERAVNSRLHMPAEAVRVTGFPYRLTLKIKDLALQPIGGPSLKVARFVATASPFDPALWVLSGVSGVAMRSVKDKADVLLTPNNLQASLRLSSKAPQGIVRLSILMEGCAGSGGWAMGKAALHLVSDAKVKDQLGFVLDAKDVQFPAPLEGPAAILGRTIQHMRLAGPINHAQTLMQDGTQAWRRAGGQLNIMSATLTFGPLNLQDGTGQLTLSPEGKWNGQMTTRAALKVNDIPLPALSAPVTLQLDEGNLSVCQGGCSTGAVWPSP